MIGGGTPPNPHTAASGTTVQARQRGKRADGQPDPSPSLARRPVPARRPPERRGASRTARGRRPPVGAEPIRPARRMDEGASTRAAARTKAHFVGRFRSPEPLLPLRWSSARACFSKASDSRRFFAPTQKPIAVPASAPTATPTRKATATGPMDFSVFTEVHRPLAGDAGGLARARLRPVAPARPARSPRARPARRPASPRRPTPRPASASATPRHRPAQHHRPVETQRPDRHPAGGLLQRGRELLQEPGLGRLDQGLGGLSGFRQPPVDGVLDPGRLDLPPLARDGLLEPPAQVVQAHDQQPQRVVVVQVQRLLDPDQLQLFRVGRRAAQQDGETVQRRRLGLGDGGRPRGRARFRRSGFRRVRFRRPGLRRIGDVPRGVRRPRRARVRNPFAGGRRSRWIKQVQRLRHGGRRARTRRRSAAASRPGRRGCRWA